MILLAGIGCYVQLENKGFASILNARPVQLVLRNKQTGKIVILDFNTQIQKWFTGKILLNQYFVLPAGMLIEKDELLLNLLDVYKSLQSNSVYGIYLANENLREEITGYNKLNHELSVE